MDETIMCKALTAEIERLTAEIERLRAALNDIRTIPMDKERDFLHEYVGVVRVRAWNALQWKDEVPQMGTDGYNRLLAENQRLTDNQEGLIRILKTIEDSLCQGHPIFDRIPSALAIIAEALAITEGI
jgi:hypothetical protein